VFQMSGLTFEQLRIPLALLLIIIVAFIFLPGRRTATRLGHEPVTLHRRW